MGRGPVLENVLQQILAQAQNPHSPIKIAAVKVGKLFGVIWSGANPEETFVSGASRST